MLQVTLREPGHLHVGEAPIPQPAPGQALVRIQRIGVCGTDLHAFRGRQPFFQYPRVLGHELAGKVVAIDENASGVGVGDQVAIEPYLWCGECRACRMGRTNCCARLEVLGVHRDGGMQEWLAVPADRLHRSERLSLEQLALVETLGIGYHAVERAGLERGEWAVVVGAGPIGLSVVQFALLAGAEVIVVDTSESRREFSRRLGVRHVVECVSVRPGVGLPTPRGAPPAAGDVEAAVGALTGPELAHAVFDATGSLEAMGASLRLAGPGGRVVMVGLAQGSFAVDDPLFHRRELTLLATRNSAGVFPTLIGLMEQGRVETSPWVTHRLELSGLPDQFPQLLDPDARVVKAMITA